MAFKVIEGDFSSKSDRAVSVEFLRAVVDYVNELVASNTAKAADITAGVNAAKALIGAVGSEAEEKPVSIITKAKASIK